VRSDSIRVAVVGPGAIGCAVAAALEAAGGREVVLCGRRPAVPPAVRPPGLEPVPLRARVAAPADEVAGADWVLLAVKAHQTEGAGDRLRRLCRPGVTVAVLQNGVGHRERVEPYAGGAAVVPTTVWVGAELAGGVVHVSESPTIRVPDDDAGGAFRSLLAGSWIAVEPVADFPLDSWRKLTVNAVAGLMALSGRRASMFRRPDVLTLAQAYARECAAVARAEGVALSDDEALRLSGQLAAAPPDMSTSMLVDRERGARLEWEARNGVVRELGAKHGVPTPVSDVVVPLLAAASGD